MASNTPKYAQLTAYLRQRIREGAYADNKRLESENELIERFGYSRQTVRHAINLLREEGLVKTIRGSGAYVQKAGTAGASRAIGVIMPIMSDYFIPSILSGIEEVLSDAGYTLTLSVTKNRVDNERRFLQRYLEIGLGGLVVEGTKTVYPNPNADLYRAFERQGIPVVFMNSVYRDLAAPHVTTDDTAAARTAVEHLVQNGHTAIAGVFGSEDFQGLKRYAGYTEGLLNAGIEPDDARVVWLRTEEYEGALRGAETERRLLDALRGCTGVICYNDQIATGVVKILQAGGLSVPGDVSIVSFDNSALAQYNGLRFTSMNHPKDAIGRKAAEMLIRMRETDTLPDNEKFPMELVRGNSVRCLL